MKQLFLAIIAFCATLTGISQVRVDYSADVIYNGGTGDFAPYFIASNNDGIITQAHTGLLRAGAFIAMDTTRRFSYSAGIDLIGSYASATNYYLQNGAAKIRPSAFNIQQLYGEVKYRAVFLSLGMKQRRSALFNHKLGSGDLIESGNARPVPQVRVGFIDFVDIPLINGWVQIQGEYSFGRMMDDNWLEDHFNTNNNSKLCTDYYLSYKRLYLRTKPTKPFSVTVGMQNAVQIGGRLRKYENGKLVEDRPNDISLKSLWHTIIPSSGNTPGNDVYYDGNSIGSWDFAARYRFKDGTQLKAYFQWPFEDGSGIGKQNGFDGIYGLEYKSAKPGIISGAVVEYFDFRNQSGPMHYAPGLADSPQDKPGEATGADDYYNNFQYNGYQNYGMAIGSPLFKSPLYNTDGYIGFTDNRIRGFHIGIDGVITRNVDYRLLFSYRYSLGTPIVPRLEKASDTSLMAEATWRNLGTKGLNMNIRAAFDAGNLYGDRFGILIGFNYSGNLTLGK